MALVLLTAPATIIWAQSNSFVPYYRNANGKKGAALKTSMCGIIYNRTEQSYNSLWTAFKTTDVRSDGKIWDMYSNITNYVPGGSAQGANYNAENQSYNREHSFPQSWFGSNTPMYTDLFHIYPTDGYVNGKRANFPFGETSNPTYTSANDFSKLGPCSYPGYTGTVFEPADEYKGDFARTYFYMVTCYEEKLQDWYTTYGVNNTASGAQDTRNAVLATLDGNTYPGLKAWQLEMLMKWAKNDPVSEKETNRNNAVYAKQGNRNPFIDYPGLEKYIWGSYVDQAFSYDHYVQPGEDPNDPNVPNDPNDPNDPNGEDKYELMTDASTLQAGDKILVAYVSGGTALALSTTQNANNRSATTDVTLNADGTLTPGEAAQVITLEKDGDHYLFNVGTGYLYAASSSANYLRTETTADDNAKATISISDNNATIAFQGSNTRNVIRYNPNNNTPIFSCYATNSTTGNLPQIYRQKPSAPVILMGDVNGNDEIDIGDAVCIVNYLVNKLNVVFHASAADLNGNDEIDIGDAVMIVNILVGKDNE